jgi:hypothetical protein
MVKTPIKIPELGATIPVEKTREEKVLLVSNATLEMVRKELKQSIYVAIEVARVSKKPKDILLVEDLKSQLKGINMYVNKVNFYLGKLNVPIDVTIVESSN